MSCCIPETESRNRRRNAAHVARHEFDDEDRISPASAESTPARKPPIRLGSRDPEQHRSATEAVHFYDAVMLNAKMSGKREHLSTKAAEFAAEIDTI